MFYYLPPEITKFVGLSGTGWHLDYSLTIFRERVLTGVKNGVVKRQNIALQLKILSQNKRVYRCNK